MKIKSLLATFAAVLAIASMIVSSPVTAKSLSPKISPQACPGKPGITVSDTKGCPGKTGISPNVSCSGTGCNGQDPVQSGCDNNVYTLEQSNNFSSNGHTWDVQLRYSNTCYTVWTRLQEIPSGGNALYNPASEGSISQDNAFCINVGGDVYKCTDHYVNTLYGVYDGAWTNMLYVGQLGNCSTDYPNAWYSISATANDGTKLSLLGDSGSCDYNGY